MTAVDRPYDAGTRRAARWLSEIGGVQAHGCNSNSTEREVSDSTRIDRADDSRVERGALTTASVRIAARVTAVLGLDLWMRAFPGGGSIRDAGQARRLGVLLACVGQPLVHHLEVPLPRRDDRPEQRAWDLVISGNGERTAAEFEARLYDLQAQERRWKLKLRDDPVDHLLVVVADTRANRRVLAEFSDVLVGLARLRTEKVLGLLRAGHPPTGVILLRAPDPRRRSRATRSRATRELA